jgi:hypothetical protein
MAQIDKQIDKKPTLATLPENIWFYTRDLIAILWAVKASPFPHVRTMRQVYKREFGEVCHPRAVPAQRPHLAGLTPRGPMDWYEYVHYASHGIGVYPYTAGGEGWGPLPPKGALDLSGLTERELDDLQEAIDAQRQRGIGVKP